MAEEQQRVVVDHGQERFQVQAPPFGRWLLLLDRTSMVDESGAVQVKPDLVLLAWMQESVRRLIGQTEQVVSRDEFAGLGTKFTDQLISAGLGLLDEQRKELELSRNGKRGLGFRGGELVCSAWSFGERNRAMQECMALENGELVMDLARFDKAEILDCVWLREPQGGKRPLTLEEVEAWPVPLGEAVMDILRTINEPANEHQRIMEHCHERRIEHPDLQMAELCLGYGWEPEVVKNLPADEAQRLRMALQIVTGNERCQQSVDQLEEDVTRIVIKDE